jgi:hypothetical protein
MDLRASPKVRPPGGRAGKESRAFDSIERTAKLVQNLVIIFGILGGAISLMFVQYDKRVERTVTMTKEFNSSVRKTYISLTSAWDRYAGDNNFYEQEDFEVFVNSFFASGNKDHNKILEENLEDLLDFFDALYVCVNTRSCDRNSALMLFRTSIRRGFGPFAFHILARRVAEKDQSVGKGLEDLYHMELEPWYRKYIIVVP